MVFKKKNKKIKKKTILVYIRFSNANTNANANDNANGNVNENPNGNVIVIAPQDVCSDNKPVILFDEFGFTHRGRLQLNVSKINFDDPHNLDLTRLAFFLCTLESWMQILQQIDDAEITCVLKSDSTIIPPLTNV
nr:protein GPR107-like [Ipomoea batatas]